jgi:hypothetical protein
MCSVYFTVFVVLCAVFRLSVVLFCVMCVICLLWLNVLPLQPGKTPFAVKIIIIKFIIYKTIILPVVLYGCKT